MFSTITKKQFEDYKSQGCNRIPLVLESFADLDTPLSVYSKLANQPFSYLLESVEGGDQYGRYSIIGLPAKLRIQVNKFKILVIEGEKIIKEIHIIYEDFFPYIKNDESIESVTDKLTTVYKIYDIGTDILISNNINKV